MEEKIKKINGYDFVSYHHDTYEEAEVIKKSQHFYHWLNKRRTVRDFSSKPIPKIVIDNILMAASTAPSGAHKQPWSFCVVSNAAIKSKIRKAAEELD